MNVSSINSNNLVNPLYQPQNSTSASGTTQGTQNTTFAQMMQTLGTDLQSGNLQSAQQDFTQLQQLLQGNTQTASAGTTQAQTQVHHHHHHHGGGSGNANSSQTNPLTALFGSSSTSQAQSAYSGTITAQAVTGVSQGQSLSTAA